VELVDCTCDTLNSQIAALVEKSDSISAKHYTTEYGEYCAAVKEEAGGFNTVLLAVLVDPSQAYLDEQQAAADAAAAAAAAAEARATELLRLKNKRLNSEDLLPEEVTYLHDVMLGVV